MYNIVTRCGSSKFAWYIAKLMAKAKILKTLSLYF